MNIDQRARTLAEPLAQASDDQLRIVARAASTLAVERTGLRDPVLDTALSALESGQPADTSLRTQVEALVQQLDEAQWEPQDQVHAGQAGAPWAKAAQRAAFRRARAANAVYFALDADPRRAAHEALYEATAATQDEEALAELIRGVVGQLA
jgi:hypothetical protein